VVIPYPGLSFQREPGANSIPMRAIRIKIERDMIMSYREQTPADMLVLSNPKKKEDI
jgi:hypothetical protein